MSDCTPTTDEVRNNMALGVAFSVIANREQSEEWRAAATDVDWPAPGLREDIKKTFDRWLAAERAKWQAEAWESGLNTGIGYKTAMDALGPDAPEPTNPYEKGSDDE